MTGRAAGISLHRTSVLGIAAVVALAAACATIVQPLGCNQSSHYALAKAMAHNTARIDAFHWETCDKSWYRGHFYSNKAPGLASVTLPVYVVLRAAGVDRPNEYDDLGWPLAMLAIPRTTIWALGLVGVVVPALALLLLVRREAERLEPGHGTAAALVLGLCTLVLPFSTLFFAHVLSALCGFGAFVLLRRERAGRPRLGSLGWAGAVAGFAAVVEYPLALLAVALGLYAVSRPSNRLLLGRTGVVARGLAFAGGALAGVAPLLLYDLWAFGSATHLSYGNGVLVQGASGHDVLGNNGSGFFGLGSPSLRVALELLFSPRGLVVLTPVVLAAAAALGLLYRRGERAEAILIGGVAALFLVYNAGYFAPWGGWAAGPRFLIPVLPFLALPLALALRRRPEPTLALAAVSALTMLAATLTQPLLPDGHVSRWWHAVRSGDFVHTLVTVAGGGRGWVALLPFLALVVLAIGCAAAATPRLSVSLRGLAAAAGALLAWALLALFGPVLLRSDRHLLAELALVAVAAVLAAAFARLARAVPHTD